MGFLDDIMDMVMDEVQGKGRRVAGGLAASGRRAQGLPTRAQKVDSAIYRGGDDDDNDPAPAPKPARRSEDRPIGFSARHNLGAPVTAKKHEFENRRMHASRKVGDPEEREQVLSGLADDRVGPGFEFDLPSWGIDLDMDRDPRPRPYPVLGGAADDAMGDDDQAIFRFLLRKATQANNPFNDRRPSSWRD